ncbi:hypothetical protein BD410DRAFT_788253 [Rickenella mellea]|uniref:Uncharacterized protein n=1 Tax=Rickenella mellea TaxID=50990 RepID=A0A4Y7Q6N0_9AGAM|nr:hypothetical protein BD410DRAFT_788253 [Rickenella mellea]
MAFGWLVSASSIDLGHHSHSIPCPVCRVWCLKVSWGSDGRYLWVLNSLDSTPPSSVNIQVFRCVLGFGMTVSAGLLDLVPDLCTLPEPVRRIWCRKVSKVSDGWYLRVWSI